MKKILLIILIFLFMYANCLAQTKNNYEDEFEKFRAEALKGFQKFKAENDSVFLSFLSRAWEEFEMFKDKGFSKPKPRKQPVYDSLKPLDFKKSPILIPERRKIPGQLEQKPLTPIKKFSFDPPVDSITDLPSKLHSFYGTSFKMYENKVLLPLAKKGTKAAAVSYFNEASNSKEIEQHLISIQYAAEKMVLNDWGKIKLVQSLANELYKDVKNKVLFTWFTLLRMGYSTRLAYAGNQLFLLCNYDVPVYYVKYFTVRNTKYYVLLFEGQNEPPDRVFTYKGKHKGQVNALSLKLTRLPKLATKAEKRKIKYKYREIEIKLDKNLLDFYTSYPNCDFSTTFNVPLSQIALKSLDSYFNSRLKGLDDYQKAARLMDFVQRGLKYQTDDEQFGCENYLFAEEALFYPYADCEDRVALFAQLIKHYTNLECIGLQYPEHMSMALRFNEQKRGVYYNYKNANYYSADPTYIGAGIGAVMPRFRNVEPGIVEIK